MNKAQRLALMTPEERKQFWKLEYQRNKHHHKKWEQKTRRWLRRYYNPAKRRHWHVLYTFGAAGLEKLRAATSCLKCQRSFQDVKPCIHHLDLDRSNNAAENLLVLCVSCHTKYHKKLLNTALSYYLLREPIPTV